ncbi:hypothetical protein [Gottschalkia purinilytica]|nr:hypothetical protein [Gottschalkia purinilytica]
MDINSLREEMNAIEKEKTLYIILDDFVSFYNFKNYEISIASQSLTILDDNKFSKGYIRLCRFTKYEVKENAIFLYL